MGRKTDGKGRVKYLEEGHEKDDGGGAAEVTRSARGQDAKGDTNTSRNHRE